GFGAVGDVGQPPGDAQALDRADAMPGTGRTRRRAGGGRRGVRVEVATLEGRVQPNGLGLDLPEGHLFGRGHRRGGDHRAAGDPLGIFDGPFQCPGPAEGTAHDRMPALDAEIVRQPGLRAHRVPDGRERKARAPWPPVRVGAGGAGGAIAAPGPVGGDDEVPVGVDGPAGTDEAIPPAVLPAVPTGDVCVPGQRVEQQDRVGGVGVQRPPRLVAHHHLGQPAARLEPVATDRDALEDSVADDRRTAGADLFRHVADPWGHRETWVSASALSAAVAAAANPSSRSARMSSMCSMPTASRTRPGLTPAASCSASLSWEWVVEAGWMTSERTSPMFARLECSSRPSTKARPAASPPAISNASTAPMPFGPYFRPRSCQRLEASPAKATDSTWAWASSHSAAFCAFATWRSMRRLRV